MANARSTFIQTGIRQRSLRKHCRVGRATELVFVLATGMMLALGGAAQAQDLEWNVGGGVGSAIGGAGTWQEGGGALEWLNGATSVDFTAGANAIFGGPPGAYTVTVDPAGVTVNNITIGASTVNIDGTGEIAMTGAIISAAGVSSNISANFSTGVRTLNAGTQTLSGNIAGELEVDGTGPVIVTGTIGSLNSDNGTTTIAAGGVVVGFSRISDSTVTVNGGNLVAGDPAGMPAVPSDSVSVLANGVLDVDAGSVGNVIVRGGTVDIDGGTIESLAQNTFAGSATVMDAGQITGLTNIDIGTFTFNGGTLGDVENAASFIITDSETVGGSFNNQTGGTLDASGVAAGTNVTLTTTGFVNAGDIDTNGTDTLTINSVDGMGGDGDITLNAGTTFDGAAPVLGGNVQLDGNVIANIDLDITNPLSLLGNLTNNSTMNVSALLTGNGNDLTNTSTLNVITGGSITGVGTLLNSAGATLGIGDGTTVSAGTITNNNIINVGVGSTLEGTANTLNNNMTINVATNGIITDAGDINNNAGGTINFNGPGGTAQLNAGGAGTGEINNLTATSAINVVSGNVTVGNDNLNTGGTLSVAGGSTMSGIAALNQTGGSIQGGGTVSSATFAQSGGGSVAAGTTVTSAGAQSLNGGTVSGNLDGAGAITVATGTTALSGGTITNAASLAVTSGTLAETGAGSIDTSGNTISLSGTGILSTDGNGIADNEAVSVAGSSALTVNGADTIASLTQTGGTVNGTSALGVTGLFSQSAGTTGGSVDINSGTFTQTGGTIAGGTTVTSAGAQSLQGGTVSGALDGAGAITVTTGTTALSGGTITNAASLAVTSGTLAETGAGSIDTAGNSIAVSGTGILSTDGNGIADNEAVSVADTGALTVNGADTIASLTQTGGTVNGASTLTVSGLFSQSGATSTTGGTVTVAAGDFTQSGGATLAAGTTVTVNAPGAKTLQGGTIAGTLNGTGNTAVNTGTTSVVTGGTITGANTTTVAATGTLNMAGGTVTSSTLTIDGGTLSATASSSVTAATVNLTTANGGTLLAAAGTTLTVNPANLSTGPGALTVGNGANTGTVVLGSTGGLSAAAGSSLAVNGGTLSFGSATVAGNLYAGNVAQTVSVGAGGTIDMGGLNTQPADLSGSGTITNGGTLTLNALNNTTFGGVIQNGAGTTALTKIGAATTTLTGANSFTGPVDVNAGELAVTGGGTLASTTLNITNAGSILSTDGGALAAGATVTANTGATFALTGSESISSLAGDGTTTLTGAGTILSLNADSTLSGVVSGDGTLNIAGGTSTVTGNVAPANTNVAAAGALVNNGTVGALTNSGGAVSLLTGSSTGSLTQTSGTTSVSGTATVVGNLDNQGGLIDLNGSGTTLNAGGTSGALLVEIDTTLNGVLETASGTIANVANPMGSLSLQLGTENGAGDFNNALVLTYTGSSAGLSFGSISGFTNQGALDYFFVDDGAGNIRLQATTASAVSGIAATVGLTQALVNTIVNRPTSPFVADLAAGAEENPCGAGVWTRATGGTANADGSFTDVTSGIAGNSPVGLNYAGLQFGGDFACFGGYYNGWDLAFGAIGGFNDATSTSSSFGLTGALENTLDSDIFQKYVGVYATAARGRFFADLQFRYEDTEFESQINQVVAGGSGLADFNTEYENKGQTLSGAVGYSWQVAENPGLTFVSSAGFSISKNRTDDVLLSAAGDSLSFDDGFSRVGFLSASLANTVILPDEVSLISYFGTATVYNDFADDRRAVFNLSTGATRNLDLENLGAYGEVSLGVNYLKLLSPGQAGNARQLNASVRVDARFSSDVESYGITGQFRLQF